MTRRELYDEIPSTQDRGVALAREGAEEGSVVVARRQTAGRGRGERSWASPRGGLYLSVVLRPTSAEPLLPLAVGSELARALGESYGVRLRLKWPNDLLAVDGAGTPRKVAGILVDRLDGSGGDRAAVVGIGVNAAPVGPVLPPELRAVSIALAELARAPIALDRLEGEVVRAAVDARRALAERAGARAIVARVRGLLYGRGEPVTVDGRPRGTLRGVRDDGALEVVGPAGAETLVAGEVRVGVGG